MDRWSAIRRVAHTALQKYEQLEGHTAFGASHGSYAQLRDIASKLYRLTVFPDNNLPGEISGWLDLDEMTLAYNPDEDESRSNFTVAHDIGHIALEHPLRYFEERHECYDDMPQVQNLTTRDGVYRTYSPHDLFELEANVFAAELLAPLAQVRAAVLSNPNWTVDSLARYFGITQTAMYNQLSALFLIAPQDLAEEETVARSDLEAGPELGGTVSSFVGRDSESNEETDGEGNTTNEGSKVVERRAAAIARGTDVASATLNQNHKDVELDDEQKEAVQVPSPALVIAGPGAGKTLVLAERVVRLVRQGAEPRKILALTFGNKAAEEMRTRIAELLPEHAHELQVTTFHALGLQLLRGYGRYLDVQATDSSTEPQLLTEADAFVFLRSRLGELPLGAYDDTAKPTSNLMPFLRAVSRAKDEMATPERFSRLVDEWEQTFRTRQRDGFESAQEQEAYEQEREDCVRCGDVARAYGIYQGWLEKEGYLDYGDLILKTIRLFDIPEIAEEIHAQYDHILVDELQDINYASGRLVKALDGGRGIVWAVGDPWQSIFQFRGASPSSLLDFYKDYPGARLLYLKTNYRSVEDIVKAGQALRNAAQALDRTGDSENLPEVPQLRSSQGRATDGPGVELLNAVSVEAELYGVVTRILTLRDEGCHFGEIAILCRKNTDAEMFATALEARGIPTDWSGQLDARPEFKDLAAVLLLAADDRSSLIRLARMPEHTLTEADLRLLLAVARERGGSAQAALYAACDGEIPGLSDPGRAQAAKLKRIAGTLKAAPTPWHALAQYLFELAEWTRSLLVDASPAARRQRTTIGQVISLVREFSSRGEIARGHDIKALIGFWRSAREAGHLDTPDLNLAGSDVVHISTVHRSKGLEWPIVFVPFLVEGKFPLGDNFRTTSLPLPPGLIHEYSGFGESAAETYLFYVAITRASKRLVLSYADKYDRRRLPRSGALTVVLNGLAEGGFLGEIRGVPQSNTVPEKPPRDQVVSHDSTEGAASAGAAEASISKSSPLSAEVINLRVLKTYADCPKRFMYEYIYNLEGHDQSYLAFYASVTKTMAWAAQESNSGRKPSEAETLAVLATEWAESRLEEHWYVPKYRRQAEEAVRQFLSRLSPVRRILVREKKQLRIGAHAISIIIDEIEERGTEHVLKRYRFSPPPKRHPPHDYSYALYSAAYKQEHPDVPHQVELVYPLQGLTKPASPGVGVLKNHPEKMGELISGIQAGQFSPNPSAEKCARCPFNLVCPA